MPAQSVKGKGMSIFDDLEKFFAGDYFYPDNPKRQERIMELGNDCKTFLSSARVEAEKSKELMSGINKIVANISDETNLPVDLQLCLPEQIQDTPYESMMNVYSNLSMNPLIQITWKMAHALIHHESFEEALKEISIQLGVAMSTAAGVVAIGALPALFIPGAINGAVSRDKLRAAIKEDVNTRKNIYEKYYILQLFNQHLESVSTCMRAFDKAEVSADQIADILKEKIDMFKENALDDEKIKKEVNEFLEQKDREEHRWTNEG